MSPIIDELDYIEYAVLGDTDYDHDYGRRKRSSERQSRQVSGDGFPVYVDEFNDNMVGDVIINLAMLIGSTTIKDYYYYDVSFELFYHTHTKSKMTPEDLKPWISLSASLLVCRSLQTTIKKQRSWC